MERPRLLSKIFRRDFAKLLLGQGVSLFGSLISRLALPFLVIYTLSASPTQMAWVRICEIVPGILVGLLAGVVVDRTARRSLMLFTDVTRAILIGSIPVLFLFHALNLVVVMAVASLMSMASMLFDSAYDAYLPTLVPVDELVDANAKLSVIASVSEVTGFGMAGILFNLLGGALTFSFDAGSFVVSAVSLWAIRHREPSAAITSANSPPTLHALRQGLATLFTNRLLFRALLMDTTNSVYFGLSGVAYMLFVSRTLHLDPIVQGILYAVGGIGSLAIASVTNAVVERLGNMQTLVVGAVIATVGTLLLPLATGPIWILVIFVLGQQIIGDSGDTLLLIGLDSVRQAHTAIDVLGRVRSAWLVVTAIGTVIGTIAGGQLASVIGLRDTLFAGVGIRVVVILITVASRKLISLKNSGISQEATHTPGN